MSESKFTTRWLGLPTTLRRKTHSLCAGGWLLGFAAIFLPLTGMAQGVQRVQTPAEINFTVLDRLEQGLKALAAKGYAGTSTHIQKVANMKSRLRAFRSQANRLFRSGSSSAINSHNANLRAALREYDRITNAALAYIKGLSAKKNNPPHRPMRVPDRPKIKPPKAKIGNIRFLEGDVYFIDERGNKRRLEKGSDISSYDRIATGKGARVQIDLKDKTMFTIDENSELVMDEYVYDPKTNAGSFIARVEKGVFRFVTGKLARNQPKKFKVKIPVGTIGPRGTIFHVRAKESGACTIIVSVGAIVYESKKTGKQTVVSAPFGITVSPAGEVLSKSVYAMTRPFGEESFTQRREGRGETTGHAYGHG